MKRAVVVGLVLATFLVAAGCGAKKAGTPCKGASSSCADPKTALACQGGKLVEVACGGPLACVTFKDHANCDTSVATLGAPCMGEEDEYSCTPDKKRALVCKGGRFALHQECRGAAGCSILGKSVSCDLTIAEKTDPCPTQGATACSSDQKEMLRCEDHRFVPYRFCRGQYGCAVKEQVPTCDESIALVGDRCGLPGQIVCSVDGKSELVCQGGQFTMSLACKNGCTVTNRPGRPIDCR